MKIMLSFFSNGEQTSKHKILPFFIFLATQSLLCSSILSNPVPSSLSNFSKFPGKLSSAATIFSACKHTPYQADCESSLVSFKSINHNNLPKNHKDVFDISVQFTMEKARSARALAYNITLSERKFHAQFNGGGGITDCLELLDDSVDLLAKVMISSRHGYVDGDHGDGDDVHTWLSAALTNQQTCLESLERYRIKDEKGVMEANSQSLSKSVSNSLALYLSSAKPSNPSNGGRRRRRLLSSGNFPTWVSAAERKLLETPVGEIEAHAVVAKDGSGTHMTISEALGASMAGGGGRTVIHVKAGTYHEYIKIPTKQKNVMLIGDGKGKSVIVGDRNYEDGWTTYESATVGAMGDGFIARDITFLNSAGPSKHQAVALRVGSDKSVIFQCSIIGNQDTLYTLSKRQFYRDTDIYGTVDFIFGDSAVVFQSCNIYARKPASTNVKNFITAQGRSSPDQNTGISIHRCKISAANDLAPVKSKYETYLGRPWKQYSRTVIMQSFIDDSIHRSGWSPWSGGFALKTLYYGEYMNSGPGSSTAFRVKWPGCHPSLTPAEAKPFTVGSFIAGDLWLPATGVSFDSGLLG
ncbi:probable pectinesterase/pectinesterase inhibitor 35 [Ziziphus jujuba]|uniref:Pectinesterase n=1 Tax=Ziziphus jujuba TaxID=326968 RepID=A0ABM3IQE0_ZIZJJ|nr:probable pectinesterase/pectinesterase inhibitor 35 [Ziziphus jujuba]